MWFPSRVPCPACGDFSSLGAVGWILFAAINVGGLLVLGAAWLQGLSLPRLIALMLAILMGAPLVWIAALRLIPSRSVRAGASSQRLV